MKFQLSVSNQTFENKPKSAEIATITYRKRELNVYELTNLITLGHTFTGLFTDNDEFDVASKNEKQFKSSSVIFIDIDGMAGLSSDDLIASLGTEDKPNIFYNTFSSTPDAERLRLVYVMDNPIESKAEYRANVKNIVGKIDNGALKIDNCSYSPFYHFFGTNIDDGNIVQCVNAKPHQTIKLKETETIPDISQGTETGTASDETIADFWKIDNREFILKYNDTYEVVNNTPIEYNTDSMFIILPKDYTEIRRKTYTVQDDVRKVKFTTTYRWKDGEGRRRKLFFNAIVRRFILPEIGFNQLLYSMVWELEHFYINTNDDYITKRDIYGIVTRAMSANVGDYRDAIVTDSRKFMVNPNYSNNEHLTKRQIVSRSRKLIHYEQIGELYDFNLTDKENIEIMKQYGVKCSLITLKRFRKDLGLARYSNTNKKTKDYIIDREVNCITDDEPVTYGTVQPNPTFYGTPVFVNSPADINLAI